MKCITDKGDLIVQGTSSTVEHKFLAIEVHTCRNASWRSYKCATHEEISQYFDHVFINVRFLNSYVNFDNMTHPKADYVEDSLSEKLDADISIQFDYLI
mmetsp:Transcript_25071/g.18896  ORF Transcript_25071/g.18896 Transcript_25071/m.18896 type:complete len:99 (+) Transcript_25071:298-594(+)